MLVNINPAEWAEKLEKINSFALFESLGNCKGVWGIELCVSVHNLLELRGEVAECRWFF